MSYASDYSTRTVSAFFDDRSRAEEAVEDLVRAGFARTSITLVEGAATGTTTNTGHEHEGFWASLKDFFMPDEDRYTYAEGLRRGGYLVTATTSDADYDLALDILDREGTVDLAERESAWRSEGWTGYRGSSAIDRGTTATTGYAERAERLDTGRDEVIPVAEEELRVGKRDVSHGRVRVRSYVVETPVNEAVNLREESVTVERRPVDRPLTTDDALFQDRTIEVEEHAEEAVVAKEARVREELVIRKDVGERTETISDTVRRTEVEIDDERDAIARRSGTGTTTPR